MRFTSSEKPDNLHVEHTSSIDDNLPSKDISDEEYDEAGYSPKETNKLLRKLDKTLLPFLALLYLLSFLDRSNIGNAKLAGLEKDLGMEGWDYAVSARYFYCHFLMIGAGTDERACHRPLLPSSFPFTWRRKSRPTWP